MYSKIRGSFSGEGLKARAMRGSVITVSNIFVNNFLRLGSNLILTRLLFPEAFGIMALVQVFMSGLQMFSDIGLQAAVVQNPRGDDPDFLNTVWTMKVIRGFLLWIAASLLAVPAAWFYNEPQLLYILPIVGFTAVIGGLATTKTMTADKHIKLGLVSVIRQVAYAGSILVMIGAAYFTQSVWALVIGGLSLAVFSNVGFQLFLPGIRNRLRWDPTAAREIFNFGKFIALSTIVGFVLKQSDKIILGKYLTLADLGVYNIGLTLATLPFMFSRAASNKIVFPLYSQLDTKSSVSNRMKLKKARRIAIALTLPLSTILAFSGPALINVMYDQRYELAGPIVTLFCLGSVAQLVTDNYRAVLFANGNSLQFLKITMASVVLQIVFLLGGVLWFGLFGALLALGLSIFLTYPLLAYYVHQHRALDLKGDLLFMGTALAANGVACWVHWDDLLRLLE